MGTRHSALAAFDAHIRPKVRTMNLKNELLDRIDCRPLGRNTGVTGISTRLQIHPDVAAEFRSRALSNERSRADGVALGAIHAGHDRDPELVRWLRGLTVGSA